MNGTTRQPGINLVPEAGDWHKLWSMRLWTLSLIFGSTAAYFTDHPEAQALLPEWTAELLRWMSGASGLFGMIARLITQTGTGK